MEQIAGQFTLGELAERIGISLETLIERTVIRAAPTLQGAINFQAAHSAIAEQGWQAVADGLREETRVHRKAWEVYKKMALAAGAGGSASSAAAPTVDVVSVAKKLSKKSAITARISLEPKPGRRWSAKKKAFPKAKAKKVPRRGGPKI